MELEYYFHKKILEPYKIDEILIPKKNGNGLINNASISELRKKLEIVKSCSEKDNKAEAV